VRLGFKFVWYDAWVGAYWSKPSRTLYICPLPFCAFSLTFPRAGGTVKGR
jgi:hypothetical protein